MEKRHKVSILDHGHLKYIDSFGSDEMIIEAARQSTNKGFEGWEPHNRCSTCGWKEGDPAGGCDSLGAHHVMVANPGDLSLLEFLYMHRHMTPFEMGDLCVEVKAPIMVFREWHRHRSLDINMSYNEMSGRYIQMPDEHYLPDPDRIQKQSKKNKQGSGDSFSPEDAGKVIGRLQTEQEEIYQDYEMFLEMGVAKEIARLNTPVSRYSKMWAKANVRNWLAFLKLRCENSAQWEIRQFANAVSDIIKSIWPRTFELFLEHDFFSVTLSRSEMRVIREYFQEQDNALRRLGERGETSLSDKKLKSFLEKLTTDKEAQYPHFRR